MAIRVDPQLVKRYWPPRPLKAHKGRFGRILIVAGSRGMAGAAALCAWGAMRSGAGLVKVAIVKSQREVLHKRGPLEATTLGLPESASGFLSPATIKVILNSIGKFEPTVMALGPGLGQNPMTQKTIRKLVHQIKLPLVLDADGLNAFGRNISVIKKRRYPIIMTPHPGEMARLMGKSIKFIQGHREQVAKALAQKTGGICLLKGFKTVVSDGQRIWINPTGNPGMASGGTGDVLTGIIASLWGQMPEINKTSAVKAALIGAFIHGAAGDKAARKLSQPGMTATDLASMLPGVIKKILRRPIR